VARLELPGVTLCAATSVNVEATVAALRTSMDQILFHDALLFTDSASVGAGDGIRVVPIRRLGSGPAYSEFLLGELSDHIRTDHCLVVQWDGFVIDPGQWDPRFLNYDYIGAPWPQFADGHDVGNGGFSLRSRRLLDACRSPGFVPAHPEDVAIGRANRHFLEREHGIVFADRRTAERFAFERTVPPGPTFGFHGIFNMVPVLGEDRFWSLYQTLDDRSTAAPDYRLLMRQIMRGRQRFRRGVRLTADRLGSVGAMLRAQA
jgi:hypothetical protein